MSSKRDDWDILQDIQELFKEIGWSIAIPMDEGQDDGKVHGIVAGNDYFIQEILKDYANYDLFEFEQDGVVTESKKKEFH